MKYLCPSVKVFCAIQNDFDNWSKQDFIDFLHYVVEPTCSFLVELDQYAQSLERKLAGVDLDVSGAQDRLVRVSNEARQILNSADAKRILTFARSQR